MERDIHSIRKDYNLHSLDDKKVNADAVNQFKIWFEEALKAEVNEPNAMVLSTVSIDLQPHSRVVLVKNITEAGFTFFTNYESKKGQQIDENPKACLLFFWPELERQVRIEGKIYKTNKEESEKYFHSRPLESQLGAHISPQSKVIPDREFLEKRKQEIEAKYEKRAIPLPENWGGYILKPDNIEFWQGRPGRLHDRLMYRFENNQWTIQRLAP
jgi:pyridoxamine 5'-phosphate oxidase